MPCRRDPRIWLGLVVCALCAFPGLARAEEGTLQRWTSARLPIDEMPAALRDSARRVADNPTLYAHGPTETFVCNPAVYLWFLDHPDRAVAAWRCLGARTVDITEVGPGRFTWSDGSGSEIRWETAYQNEQLRIWLAEGSVKPGPLMRAVPFQALVVLRHVSGKDDKGRGVVRHQADLILYTDSKSALLLARLLGTSAPRLAEQYVGQLEMFFSALPWYIEQHPERADELLSAQTSNKKRVTRPR